MDEELASGKYPRTETSLVLPLVVHCLRQQEHEGHFCGGQEFPVTIRYIRDLEDIKSKKENNSESV